MNRYTGLLQELTGDSNQADKRLWEAWLEYGDRVNNGESRAQVLTDIENRLSAAEKAALLGLAFEYIGEDMKKTMEAENRGKSIHRH